jgi:aminomethyltransferase
MRTIGGIARLSLSYRSISSSSAAGPRKTALHDIHVKNGGNMVEYGGFEMPVLYKSQSISDSVIWTRNKASLFDVTFLLLFNWLIVGGTYATA